MISDGEVDGTWVTFNTVIAIVSYSVPATGGPHVATHAPDPAIGGDLMPVPWNTTISSRVRVELAECQSSVTGGPIVAALGATGQGVAATDAEH